MLHNQTQAPPLNLRQLGKLRGQSRAFYGKVEQYWCAVTVATAPASVPQACKSTTLHCAPFKMRVCELAEVHALRTEERLETGSTGSC